jgi:hypothetical protein
VLGWVVWRGITDMLIAHEAPVDVVAVVAASIYLLVVPFAWSLVRSLLLARKLRRDLSLRRTFE